MRTGVSSEVGVLNSFLFQICPPVFSHCLHQAKTEICERERKKERVEHPSCSGKKNNWNGRHCTSLVPWQDRNSKIKTGGSTSNNVTYENGCFRGVCVCVCVLGWGGGGESSGTQEGIAGVNGKHCR